MWSSPNDRTSIPDVVSDSVPEGLSVSCMDVGAEEQEEEQQEQELIARGCCPPAGGATTTTKHHQRTNVGVITMRDEITKLQSDIQMRIDSGYDSLYSSDRLSSTDSSSYPQQQQHQQRGTTGYDNSSGFAINSDFNVITTNSSGFISGDSDLGIGGGGSDHCDSFDVAEKLGKLSLQQVVNKFDGSGRYWVDDEHEAGLTNSENIWEDAFQQDRDGDNMLHLAIIHGFDNVVANIIQHRPYPEYLDIQNNLFQTAMHLAVLTGQSRVVRQLVLAGATIDVRDRRGNTGLHLACQQGDIDCARKLVQPISIQEMNQCQINRWDTCSTQYLDLRNYDGQMCIHLAALNNHHNIIRFLRDYGADINIQEGKSGRTALHYAIEANNVALVDLLVRECYAKMDIKTFGDLVPIQLAHLHKQNEICALLLRQGASDVELPSSDSDSDSSSEGSMEYSKDLDCDFELNSKPLASVLSTGVRI